jgi:dTDP-4-dehydrorhamnose reductase
VLAITVWSILGCYDWNKLLTCNVGYYEAGPFDVRSGQLRPTLLSKLVRALASGQPFQHPVMQSPGWWQRPQRILFRTSGAEVRMMNEENNWLHPAEALQELTHAA